MYYLIKIININSILIMKSFKLYIRLSDTMVKKKDIFSFYLLYSYRLISLTYKIMFLIH